MSFLGLAICLTLLAYGVAVGAGSLLGLPFLRSVVRLPHPAARARWILALRLLPAALGVVVAVGVILPAFVRHEPRATEEPVGTALLVGAALSGALVLAGSARGAAGVLATRRLVRRWRRTGRPIRLEGVTLPAFAIDDPFPIVTVAGWARPRLFVAQRVLSGCTSTELAAIVAHELGHLRRRDPWSHLLLRACPDVLACTPFGTALERRWASAAEQAADDYAADGDATRAFDLASALLAVVRLARDVRPGWIPAIALYRGGGVAERVARLLEPPRRRASLPRGRLGVIAAIALAAGLIFVAVGAGLDVWQGVHRLLETVVNEAW